MKKTVYRVRTQYIFEGVFEIVAESKEEARQKVRQDCGLVMGGNIHSTLPDEEVNWAFSIHPDVKMGRIIVQERTKKVAKKPEEKHLVTFDSELGRLKSNKKPSCINSLLLIVRYRIIFFVRSSNCINLYSSKSNNPQHKTHNEVNTHIGI